ncbi:Kelch-Like Protein 9 [Manis pentadactyla]|nr:Kelch-Like Protein 9 [Manis pentadactyla]
MPTSSSGVVPGRRQAAPAPAVSISSSQKPTWVSTADTKGRPTPVVNGELMLLEHDLHFSGDRWTPSPARLRGQT